MAESDAPDDQEVTGSIPAVSGNILAWIDRELFSTVILCRPLIQEEHYQFVVKE